MRHLKTIATLVLASGFAVGSACGQTGSPGIKVKIPFQFVIEGKNFSAGYYSFYSSREKVWVQEASGRNVAVSFTGALEGKVPERDGKVIFTCYFDECFLSQVWIAGQETGQMVPKSKRQIQLAKTSRGQEFALLGTKPHG